MLWGRLLKQSRRWREFGGDEHPGWLAGPRPEVPRPPLRWAGGPEEAERQAGLLEGEVCGQEVVTGSGVRSQNGCGASGLWPAPRMLATTTCVG